MAGLLKPVIQFLPEHEGEETAEHMTSDGCISLVEDGPCIENRLHIPEDLLHLYLDDSGPGLITSHVGFTVLKNIEDNGGLLTVYTVKELYDTLDDEEERKKLEKENGIIVKRFCEKMSGDIDVASEYTIQIPQK